MLGENQHQFKKLILVPTFKDKQRHDKISKIFEVDLLTQRFYFLFEIIILKTSFQ